MKKLPELGFKFGERLRELRKQAGLTQIELGKLSGVSNRVIAYYEYETVHPPAALLPKFAKALHVTIDELLGIKPLKKKEEEQKRAKIWKKLKQFEELSQKDQKFILHYIKIAAKQK